MDGVASICRSFVPLPLCTAVLCLLLLAALLRYAVDFLTLFLR